MVPEPQPAVQSRVYRDGRVIRTGLPLAEVAAACRDDALLVWVDLIDPPVDLLDRIRVALNLHPLATEDALENHQRPKLDRYGHHRFLAAYGFTSEGGIPAAHEVNAFITDRALVTVRRDADYDFRDVTRRWDSPPGRTADGVAFLLHGLLDSLVDSQLVALHAIDERLEDMETRLFDAKSDPGQLQRQIFDVRKDVGGVRRLVVPMREVLDQLVHREDDLVPELLRPFYADVADHVIRASAITESQREQVNSLIDANLNLTSNRLNAITKALAGWAAVIAVPTAVTGFFGQNVPYPGFGHTAGLIESVVTILVVSVGLYLLLRRRDWI